MTPPMMMDPLHSAMDVVPTNLNSYHHHPQYTSTSPGFGSQGHDRFHGDQARRLNPPGSRRAESRLDDGNDRASMVWVNGLSPNMTEQALVEVFRQFGTVVSCVRKHDGNKPNGAQYAFVKYNCPQEAQYAINVGEVEIQGHRVMIKARNSGRGQTKHSPHESSDCKSYDKASQQIFSLISKSSHGPVAVFDGNMDGSGSGRGHAAVGPPVLMSKALVVANIPQEMCPKSFYMLFSEVGPVDGCYIFPQPDHLARRFGHVVMKSFYMAQKCVETFHGCQVHGCVLDVSYFKNPDVDPLPMTNAAPIMHMASQPPAVMFPTAPSQYYNQTQQPSLGMAWPQPQPQQQQQQQQGVPSQQGMPPQQVAPPQAIGNVTPTQYGAISPQFAILHPPQAVVPVFNGQGPVFNQPVVGFPEYHSQSPSPPHQAVRWVPQERRQVSNARQFRRQPAPPPGFSSRASHAQSLSFGSGSETQSGSVSNGSESTMVSTAPPSEEPTKSELVAFAQEQQHLLDSAKDTAVTADTGIQAAPSMAAASPVFEILSPQLIPETSKPMDPCNLFVKNLDDNVVGTAEDLQAIFEKFGPVASAHLVTFDESKISKGFGFVAFTKAEDAARAKDEVNNSLIGRKRVFVSYAEKKEDRAKRLKSLFSGSPDAEDINGTHEKEEGFADSLDGPSCHPGDTQGVLPAGGDPEERALPETPEERFLVDTPGMGRLSLHMPIGVLPGSDESVVRGGEVAIQDEDKVQDTCGVCDGGNRDTIWRDRVEESIEAVQEEEKRLSQLIQGRLGNTSSSHLDIRPKNPLPAAEAALQDRLNKPGAGNKRTPKKGVSTQKYSGSKVQVAVPIMQNGGSLGRSSRIPVQNKNSQMPTSLLTGPRLQDGPKEKGTTPTRKRGHKGRKNGRNTDRNTEIQKSPTETHEAGKNSIGQFGITVSAH